MNEMRAIDIARRLAELGQVQEACQAYTLAIHENSGEDPALTLEGALYILQMGGNYKVAYDVFLNLYREGQFKEDVLSIMTGAFYEPNVKLLKNRYQKNCKILAKYPYLFRKDFLSFDALPIRFYPYDDNSYMPFYREKERFDKYIDFSNPVISRNFFKDLEKPVLATNVFSQYELEYLNDNVRKSEHIGRENHLYLHYTSWPDFCAHLQVLNVRKLLEDRKIVFLIEDQIEQYPIDFKTRFGIDYSQYSVKPIGIREITRMIWHTQLSSHNGGDFFNEIFDAHPNLLYMSSVMFDHVEQAVERYQKGMDAAVNLQHALEMFSGWEDPHVTEELYRLQNRKPKDFVVAAFLADHNFSKYLDHSARIVPSLYFQPHFPNLFYDLTADDAGRAILCSRHYEQIKKSSIFQGFKYIKTFTPMRRLTTSYAASVRFMYAMAKLPQEAYDKNIVDDAVTMRICNRGYMRDPQDRLFKDSVLVRFEDSKLNSKAVFAALAAFLDIPYTESMNHCTFFGKEDPNAPGFSPDAIYRTYDEFANRSERVIIEYFMRDAYETYGYDFHYYDGSPMDEEKVEALCMDFTTLNSYIRETWKENIYRDPNAIRIILNGKSILDDTHEDLMNRLVEEQIKTFTEKLLTTTKIMLKGLRFYSPEGHPLEMMPQLELDPALLERPMYH